MHFIQQTKAFHLIDGGVRVVLLFDWSRMIIEDWITILRFAYLTAMSTLNIAKMKEPRKKNNDRRLKSSVARLLKLTTYWILRTEHWSQCLYTRLFHHIRFHRYTDCGIHSLSHTLSFHCFHSVRILLLFLCLCCLFFRYSRYSGFTMSTTVWKGEWRNLARTLKIKCIERQTKQRNHDAWRISIFYGCFPTTRTRAIWMVLTWSFFAMF